MERLARLVASGFGVGYVPAPAPGTVGAAAATLVGGGLMLAGPLALPLAACVACLIGLWAIRATVPANADPAWVVIDEVAGQWIALLGLARPSAFGLLLALAVFRLLDVVKPGPIGWADRQGGALGVMADDLIAGAFTAGIVWALRTRWPAYFP
jgi:phosphatidylglycerophosphatase A